MKFIGQFIQDFIARFRNDVYLENISSGTIASGGNLGLDSNNKIVKATDSAPTGDTDTAGIVELATTAETTTGTDGTRAVTPDGLKDGYQGSTNVTTLGTITTGTWQGTAIASAYLDADTAHYSATRQLTYYMFRADIDQTKTYIGLQEADGESSTSTNKNLPILTPVTGKLLKVFLRATNDISDREITFTLETQAAGSNTGAAPTVIGTQSGAGCTNQTMTTYDFTTSLDSGTNAIAAGDTVQLAMQSASNTATTTYYITCLWEWNLS